MFIYFCLRLFEGVCVNSRHPGPRRVWKVGSGAHLLPPLWLDPLDPLNIAAAGAVDRELGGDFIEKNLNFRFSFSLLFTHKTRDLEPIRRSPAVSADSPDRVSESAARTLPSTRAGGQDDGS